MDFGTGSPKAERARRVRERALRKLEIPGTLDHAFRSVGGRETAIAMARLAAHRDEQMRELVAAYDELSQREQREPSLLEKLALGVGLHPAEFFGRVTAVAYRHNFDVAQFTAAMKVREIIERRAEYAMDKDGYKDAELILKAGGVIQTGPLVQVNQSQTTQTLNVAAGLPPVEELSGKVSELIRPAPEQKQLTEGALGFSVAKKEEAIDVEPIEA